MLGLKTFIPPCIYTCESGKEKKGKALTQYETKNKILQHMIF